MLTINIPGGELYDEAHNKFITLKGTTLCLEHSLVSISKWESKYHKAFLSKYTEKSDEEIMDYIRCMTISQNINPEVYSRIPNNEIQRIINYINDPMTATVIKEDPRRKRSSEIVTSELIYCWMVQLGIPMECQKWHINRLMTLIQVINIKNQPGKKIPKNEMMRNNHALNQARRAKAHSRG